MGPQKSLQFQPKWRFLALKFETFCYYNCFYPFLLRLTVILAKSLKNWGILIRMAVILVETGCSLEKCMLFSLTGSKMLQFSNLKTTVQECQRRHKKIPPSEIKELHCNKVPLTRNYVRNYPFKSNDQVFWYTVGQRNYTFWNFIHYGEKDYWLISQQIRHKKQVQLFFQ